MQPTKRRSTMPWFKCYPRDFFDGTEGMDAELRGYYALVLMLLYELDGELQDDEKFIARRLGMSTRKWRSVRAKLLAIPRKLMAGGGYIRNFRADVELWERRESSAKQSRKARQRFENKENTECRGNAITDTDARAPALQDPCQVVPLANRRKVAGDGGE